MAEHTLGHLSAVVASSIRRASPNRSASATGPFPSSICIRWSPAIVASDAEKGPGVVARYHDADSGASGNQLQGERRELPEFGV
jgi:hypothetical protein